MDRAQILSIAFELAEYSLQHQLANFAEVCFSVWSFDRLFIICHISVGGIMYVILPIAHIICHNSSQWILDVLICNWIGTYLGMFPQFHKYSHVSITHYSIGMKVCQYFEVKVGIIHLLTRLRLKNMLSLTNGAVSDKLMDYARKLDVCSASFHHTILQRSNGGLPHLSHITLPWFSYLLSSSPRNSTHSTSKYNFARLSACPCILNTHAIHRPFCGWNLIIRSLSCGLRLYSFVHSRPCESFFNTSTTQGKQWLIS
jgi:hypothetical protein